MLQIVHAEKPIDEKQELPVTNDSLLEHKVIKNALQFIGKRKEFKEIVMIWPNLEPACLKLATYTSDVLLSADGQPVINKCLLDAITAYENSAGQDDPERIRAFMSGIIAHAPSFLNHRIYCKSSMRLLPRAWEAFAEPLMFWLRKSRCETVLLKPHNELNRQLDSMCFAKNMLFARVFNMRDAAMAGDVSSLFACANNDACQCLAGDAQR